MKTPLWMTVIIIIFLLPVFAFPILLANLPALSVLNPERT